MFHSLDFMYMVILFITVGISITSSSMFNYLTYYLCVEECDIHTL